MQLRALSSAKARRAVASPLATTFSRGSSVAHTIGRPSAQTLPGAFSAWPGNPDNQFANLNAKSSNPLDSPFHSSGLPRLLSDPTLSVQIFVKSARGSVCFLVSTPDTSSPPGRGISPGTSDCCAVPDISTRNTAQRSWAHDPVKSRLYTPHWIRPLLPGLQLLRQNTKFGTSLAQIRGDCLATTLLFDCCTQVPELTNNACNLQIPQHQLHFRLEFAIVSTTSLQSRNTWKHSPFRLMIISSIGTMRFST